MGILNKYIREDLENLYERFLKASIIGDQETASSLIEEAPDVVNFQDPSTGLTGLMMFASDGCYTMVDKICSLPCSNVNLEDADGRSAEWFAYKIGRDDIRNRIAERIWEDISGAEESDGNDSATNNVVQLGSTRNPSDPKI